MNNFPEKLHKKLQIRKEEQGLRRLGIFQQGVDFSSNDYLGFAYLDSIFNNASKSIADANLPKNGATGSRLLSGNSNLFEETEAKIARFHAASATLLFNSGYDANLGFFASVPQRGDLVLYDEYIHASIRDGIRMGMAKSIKFKHNSVADLKRILEKFGFTKTPRSNEIYVVTESVFSMDGDSSHLEAFASLCAKNHFRLVVDEAHALGVFGKNGAGLVQELGLQNKIFACMVTFGKALGCHGAAILGSQVLKNYIVNFARSFIYTTALPPHSVASLRAAYEELETTKEREKLHNNIVFFRREIEKSQWKEYWNPNNSAIHTLIIPGNQKVKKVSKMLQDHGFNVKPILSPTVPLGKERLRFCLHSYNSKQEISEVLKVLGTFVK